MSGRLLALLVIMTIVGCGLSLTLDVTIPEWDDRAPFTAALAQALLATPLLALVATAIFDRISKLRQESNERALRDELARGIKLDSELILDLYASQLFELGARFPSALHLKYVLSACINEATADVGESVIFARLTGAEGVVRETFSNIDLRRAARQFDELVHRLGRIAAIDPDYLVMHAQGRRLSENSHLWLDRYTASAGAGRTPQMVISTAWCSVQAIQETLNAVNRGPFDLEWEWPREELGLDLPRPENEPPIKLTTWQMTQNNVEVHKPEVAQDPPTPPAPM